MKKTIISLCTAGLLLAGAVIPASAAYLGNVKPGPYSAPTAVGAPTRAADTAGMVSFENLEERMRKGNPTVLSLQATLDSQKVFDREQAYEDMVDAINGMVDLAWALGPMGMGINAQAESMRAQLDGLKEENYAETMEALTIQIDGAIRQVLVGGQALYLNILSMEGSLSDLRNVVSSLDRTLGEMELRYRLGQISQLQLQEFKATHSSTKSQLTSLELGVEKMKANLQNMLGEKPTGELTLAPLPPVTEQMKKVYNMAYADALVSAKAASSTIFAATETLEDAKDAWFDARFSSNRAVEEQKYNAAVFDYDSAVKNFELSFHSLYLAVPEAQQKLEAAQTAMAAQEQKYAAAQLRHDLGQLSDAAFSTAKDELGAAQSALAAAELALFGAYENYRWAVELGVVG